jgi:hypothetical protein
VADSLTLEVDRADPALRRVVEEPLPDALSDGEVLLAVDRFALTANNMTYALVGDSIGYWRFFPTNDDRWGRIPAMAYADVIASAHPEVRVGERVWGFFPMGTHLRINAGKIHETAFSDVSPHRDGLAPVYAQFQRAATNPIHEAGREEQDCLLRGLFLTSWLCEDALHDEDYYSAGDCVITSASSKTSIALAFAIKERGKLRAIGLTSAGNAEFCRGLGCYDRVLTYDDIDELPRDRSAMLVDMAGNGALNAAIHAHYANQLRYDCRIGVTHRDAPPAESKDLSGPRPQMFFAPKQAQKRGQEWGPLVLEQRLASAFARFREFADSWLEVRRFDGREAADRAFGEVLEGRAPPQAGYSVSLSDSAS